MSFLASTLKCVQGYKEAKVATDCHSSFDRCVKQTHKATSVTTYFCSSKETMELVGAEDGKCKNVGIGDAAAQYCVCKTDDCSFDLPLSGNEAKGLPSAYLLSNK